MPSHKCDYGYDLNIIIIDITLYNHYQSHCYHQYNISITISISIISRLVVFRYNNLAYT